MQLYVYMCTYNCIIILKLNYYFCEFYYTFALKRKYTQNREDDND